MSEQEPRRRGTRAVPSEYLEDCEVGDPSALRFVEAEAADDEPPKPEPLRRVRVRHPFQVVFKGVPYWPDAVAEVPESLAAKWVRDQWVVSDE